MKAVNDHPTSRNVLQCQIVRLLYCCLAVFLGACANKQNPNATVIPGPSINESGRPMLAIWRDFDGYESSPRLRVLIWNDGRMVFCKDAPEWGTNLYQGNLTSTQIAELKTRIRSTGIFRRSQISVEPDEAICNLLLDFGTERQFLTWDERGLRSFWDDRSQYPLTYTSADFKRAWVSINRIALEFAPQHVIKFTNSFEEPPQSWYEK